MENVKKVLRLWLPLVVYMGVIIYFSSLSNPVNRFKLVLGADKLVHFFEYMILGILITRALIGSFTVKNKKKLFIPILLIGIIFSASDELHQYFVPNRSMELGDFIADLLGVVTGSSLVDLMGSIKRSLVKVIE